MAFQRIIRSVFFQPWQIQPEAHYSIQKLVAARLAGVKAGDLLIEFSNPQDNYEVRDGIAYIPLQGVMGRKLSLIEKKCGGVDTMDVMKQLAQAEADESVQGVIILADTPGGQCMGTPELAQAVADLAEQIPVFTYVDGTLASAGVYACAASTQIYASLSSEVGSIGTYMAILDESQAFADDGVKVEVFKSGKFKAAGMPGTSLTDEQRQQFQQMINDCNQKFQTWVSQYRPSVKADDMQGQVFWSEAAQTNGLIDYVGSLENAVRDIKALAAK